MPSGKPNILILWGDDIGYGSFSLDKVMAMLSLGSGQAAAPAAQAQPAPQKEPEVVK